MKHWLGDTLSKRLFILMWVALVGSHLVAFMVVTRQLVPREGGPARSPMGMTMPTLPSLPPTPGLLDAPSSRPPPPGGPGAGGPPSLPTGALLLDYGIRFLLIGGAAWWGARWLSAPMRRLVGASRSLGASLGGDAPLPKLNEARGTVEVREAAQVFNEMAARLNEQFKARGLLVAAISHDLRTPLTRMRMRLESFGDDAAAQRCIADIREMNELIDSVLQMFRGAAGLEAAQRTDVFALVQSLTDDLLEQGQPVSFHGTPALAQAQPAALRRVVSNLLHNALRYGERAEVAVTRDAAGVRIVIDDVGPGIPPAQLEAVFQPFYRVEGSRNRDTGGTGLGLYIARDLVQRQGGTLTLANRSAGGLRAEVQLPPA